MNFFNRIKNSKREMRDIQKFLDSNSAWRQCAFYSEKNIYHRYLEGFLEVLMNEHERDIAYLTSDPDDELFRSSPNRLHPYFVQNLLQTAFHKFDGKVLLMTMPDLNQFHIKRASNEVWHIYTHHAAVSTHMQYRKGAFDYYDAVLCVGPHHIEEIRRAENVYGTKSKELIECGYPYLEKIYTQHQNYRKLNKQNKRKKILIAPTWGDVCILNSCIHVLLDELVKLDEYDVVVRPHPEFVKRDAKKARALSQKVQKLPGVTFETNLLSTKSLHEADILITDQSGIAFEYALGTERPVLFVDTPLKVHNPEYTALGIEPVEVGLRSRLGVRAPLDEVENITHYVEELNKRKEEFTKDIIEIRSSYIFNWMKSAEVGAQYINEKIKTDT